MRLIDADALLNAFDDDIDTDVCQTFPDCYSEWGFSRDTVERAVTNAPTIEAEPVKHGRWENHPHMLGFVRCSVCHDCTIWGEWADGKKWNYCPHCGAKMDGGDAE